MGRSPRVFAGDSPKPVKGQVWKRKTDGLEVVVTQGGDRPRTYNLRKQHIQHHITIRDLYRLFEFAGHINSYDGNPN